ncbi:conserved hypothetical protein [delta proteobacterium NaphS2]|nr:conserved hypothetical protein [delta proteobacterium NaphS2]
MILCAVPIFARADAVLTVTPITWNIVGLDSNNPASGPTRFPVGVRIRNEGSSTADTVQVTFAWDDGLDPYTGGAYINLRPGSLSSVTIPSLAVGASSDVYFEAEITQVSAAFDKTRRYHVTATDALGVTGTSPQPRQLYVEHLVSQNRNGITSIKLNGATIPAGGSMTLIKGSTYTIELAGFTATQGYNQLESFVNFPNTIFQIQSVSSTYSADDSPYVNSPNDELYANACLWENDPNSPNYSSCVGGGYKAGGTVDVTYTVKIIGGEGTSNTLNSMFYDFSGSSFHYNADYVTGFVIADIVSSSSVTIAKSFSPKAMSPGATSTLTFRLSNPTPETIEGVNFSDNFPTGLEVANPANVTYSGCGGGAFSPVPAPSDTTLSFANGTLFSNSVCTVTVDVTAPGGEYPNTTGHLYINTTEDTGNVGSDTLTAADTLACIPGQILASWTFEPSAGTSIKFQ